MLRPLFAAGVLLFSHFAVAVLIDNIDLANLLTSAKKRYLAPASGSALGSSVSKGGDVNGDGRLDILVGGNMAYNQGIVYVIFGKGVFTEPSDVQLSSFVSGEAGFKIYNGENEGSLGYSLAGGDDFNDDGYDDVVVGQPLANSNTGAVHVVFGHSNATQFVDVDLSITSSGLSRFAIIGPTVGGRLGLSVSFAGDYNGDGKSDLVIGSGQDTAFVILGRVEIDTYPDIDLANFAPGPFNGFQIKGPVNVEAQLGISVAGAGDVNGDGKADIIIGAPFSDPVVGSTTRTDAGVAYVLFGTSIIPSLSVTLIASQASSAGFKIIGSATNVNFGNSVAGAGDINGDGVADMIVGACHADPVGNGVARTDAGMTFVIFGRSNALGTASYTDIDLLPIQTAGSSFGFAIIGAKPNDMSGFKVGAAGDVNRDGIDDVLVGAYMADNGGEMNAGVVNVIYGRDALFGASSYVNVDLLPLVTSSSTIGFTIFGASMSDMLGFSVCGAGDVNSDGSSDIILGATMNTLGSASIGGTAYVVFGASPAPSARPTAVPSISMSPSKQPTYKPTNPTPLPSAQSTHQPTSQPTRQPSRQPSEQPSSQPSSQPSRQPISFPSAQPSGQPASRPSGQPSSRPTCQPSGQPASRPSAQPSGQPSMQPVSLPSRRPSGQPSSQPSSVPNAQPTSQPSNQPFGRPSAQPSSQPVSVPTNQPTVHPSAQPSGQPTSRPSSRPSGSPTSRPSADPTSRPSAQPTGQPTSRPSARPTLVPSSTPSSAPTSRPSAQPTGQPTSRPSAKPTLVPSSKPSSAPTAGPSAQPTSAPTSEPTGQPTSAPTSQPSSQPTAEPSVRPTSTPSAQPTSAPTSEPSGQPTSSPSALPTSRPTARPSVVPSAKPTPVPSAEPTELPSASPTFAPSSVQPSAVPTVTAAPTPLPTRKPSLAPSGVPTLAPSRKPRAVPTAVPSAGPSVVPTVVPGQTQVPSRVPTAAPSLSQEALWRAELAEVLATAPADSTTAAVSHRSTYYELDVAGAAPSSNIYGSCSAWRSLLNGDLTTSKEMYQPVSMEHVQQQELNQESLIARCDDASVVSALLDALTDTTNAAGSTQTLTCGEDAWVVNKCAGSNAPALCVGCTDPCAASNHCSDERSAAQSSISPCVTTSCGAGTSLESGLRMLRVSFAENVPAPSFLSRSVTSTTTSLTVTAQLSAPGSVFCAAYLLDPQSDVIPAPTSTGSLMLQNFVGATDNTNTTVVTISGLQSATDFLVYCMSVSRTGSVQSLSDVLAQPLTPSTTCCIPVVVQTSSSSVRESQATKNFLTMTVNARPSVDIVVSVTVLDSSTGGEVLPVPLFPASFRINALSSATATFGLHSSVVSTSQQLRIQTATMTSSLLALPAGNYTYNVTISGASVSQYGVVYAQTARSIVVLSSGAALPAPVLSSAVFSDDGSYVAISFDSNTDKGRTATQFTCSALFSFACASTSACVWTSSKQVNAYVNGGAGCAVVDSTVMLSATAVIKAQCPTTTACNSSTWAKAVVGSVIVTAPTSGVTPSVSISASSTVGACDALTLDISGSSGNGGRPWLSRSIQVETSATTNVTDLQYFLSHKYQASPPTAIPAALLSKGHSYNFVVTLCNFLGKCSQANKRVLALDRTVPTVLLPGGALRTTTRSTTLSISSNAYTVQCGNGGAAVRSGLTYAWTVSTGGAVLLNAVSTSKDPSKLVLPPYSLQVGTTYEVTLTATVAASAQSASATVQVYVQQGDIKAVVAGGTSQTVRAGEALTLDVSGSFDEDQAGLTGLGAGLVSTWSCVQVQPIYSSSCDSVAPVVGGSSPSGKMTYTLLTEASAQDAVVQVSVFLLDAARTRSAETVITVTIVAPLSPSVALTSNVAASGVFNSNRELQLTATVGLPAAFNGTAVWSVDDTSNFNFAAAVRSPVSVFLAPVAGGAVNTVYLVLAANTLPGRDTFSLTAMVPRNGLSTVGSVVVTVNAPPQAGSFAVTPANGTEIVDQFTFLADRWIDSDLPLQYQFAYVSVSGAEVTVRSKLEVAYGSTPLFAGLAVRNFSVSCVVHVFDSLAASSSATAVVQVFKEPTRSAASLSAVITDSLGDAASSVDGLKQATALGSYLLNDVDCSAAPNCAALHRDECFRTANTCGECLSPAFVGDAGDSNHACVEVAVDFDPASAFQSCDDAGKCVSVSKTCPSGCTSPQGRCIFVNADTGAEVLSCFVGATDCNAVCDCEEDFIGSETCSLNSTQLLQKQALRSQVIQGIKDLVALEDPDRDTVAGWVESVVSAAQSPDELSQDGVTTLLDTVTTVMRSAKGTTGVSVDAISRLMRSVDASVRASANAQRRRRRLQGENTQAYRLLQESSAALNSTLARTESILSLYRSFAADNLLVGQDAVSLVLPQFRVLVQKQSLVGSAAASNVTLSAPSSALEGLSGRSPNSIAVPVLGSQSSLGVSLTTMRSELYNTELSLNGADQVFSSPLSVELSDTNCEGGSGCRFEMVLQISPEMSSFTAAKSAPVTHNTTCAAGDVSNHTYICPDGSSVTGRCPGYASTVISRCPVESFHPVCNSVGGSGVTGSGCTLVASTDTTVTCSCPMSQSRRMLQQSTDDDDTTNNAEASVSYVAMLSQVKDNFEQTILSAQGLDASTVEDGFSAILTVGCIAAAVLFGLSWAHQADANAAKIKPKSESEKKKTVAPAASKTGFMQSVRNLFTRKTSRNRAIAPATKWCVNKDVQIAEQALPAILSSTSLTHRVKDEIKNRHKWLGIVFFFSPSFPRVLRVISLATNVIIMLFIQSLTYALTNPDDGLCETYLTKPACLEPDSPYATGASKCFWTESTGECAVVQPDSSVKVILFVAIFSAIIATPLALLIDWLVFNVLSAPTRTSQNTAIVADTGDLSPNLAIVAGAGNISERRSSSRKRSSLTGTVRNSLFGNVTSTDGSSIEHTATLSAQSDMSKLVQELTAYRGTLTAEQKVEFDAIWGLDEHGYFRSGDENVSYWSRAVGMCKSNQRAGGSTSTNVAQHVLTDLKSVHTSLLTETATATDVSMSEQERGKRLLFLFQCDLLPGISGKILDSKGKRDNLTVRHVSFESKVAVWTFLAAANVGMLFFILLFALSQTVHRQGAWALSFVMWLVVEVLFVSSATVLFTHVFIPSLIMQDVNKIKLKLVDSIRAFNKGVRSRNRGAGSQKGPEHFNAAEYLFVSTRLAAQSEWSDLREAQIIALFRTPWPKQSYQRESDVSQTYSRKYAELYRSVSIVAIFFLTNLLQIPPAFQDMVIQMCTTAAVGYAVLLHIDLYDVFPALVIIPCLIIGLLVYMLIRYNAKRAQRRLEKTFPMDDVEGEDEEEDVQAVELEKSGDFQGDHAVSAKHAAFQMDQPASPLDAEDELIARAALDLAQTGELHLPPPETAAVSQGPARSGHTTRKQSVIAGLRVLNVLQETRGPTSVVSVSVSGVSESQDQSDSDTDHQAESKQGDHEHAYSENLYSVDELPDSVDLQSESEVGASGTENTHKPHPRTQQSSRPAASASSYSLTPSEEEALYDGFHGDSDVEETYFSDVDEEGEEGSGVEEEAKDDEERSGDGGSESGEESGEEESGGEGEEGEEGEEYGGDESEGEDGEDGSEEGASESEHEFGVFR